MSRGVQAVIVDDEPLAREGLLSYLEPRDDIEVVAVCEDGVSAVEAIEEHEPDVIFLDIQMPEMSGFDVIERVGPERMPAIVFVTAYDEFALKAFEAAALDYVLKPLDEERVERALRRVHEQVRRTQPPTEELRALLRYVKEARSERRFATRLKVREGEHIRFVEVRVVEWFEADGNYVVLHAGDAEARIRSTMSGLEEVLDPGRFVRVHRSTIINLDHLKEVQPWFSGDYLAIMKSGEQIRVSRRYKEDLLRDVI